MEFFLIVQTFLNREVGTEISLIERPTLKCLRYGIIATSVNFLYPKGMAVALAMVMTYL